MKLQVSWGFGGGGSLYKLDLFKQDGHTAHASHQVLSCDIKHKAKHDKEMQNNSMEY